jgi:hypothetical protein
VFVQQPLTPQFRAFLAQRELQTVTPPDPPAKTTIEFTIGLDLGKSRDYSVLCVIQRTAPPVGEATYAVRHLHRWPLGTPYAKVANEVAELAYRPALGFPRIAADVTGVGQAVMEMIRAALRAKAGGGRPVQLCPVVIAGGHAVRMDTERTWHVAKGQLVSVLQALLSSRRLQIAKELPETKALVAELKAFSAKITTSGNEKYEALQERLHDDMVLALAMALWLADKARGRFEIL